MKKKHVSLLLAAAMAASVISGCGSSANNSTAETTKAEGAAAETTAAGETEATAEAVEDTDILRATTTPCQTSWFTAVSIS